MTGARQARAGSGGLLGIAHSHPRGISCRVGDLNEHEP